MPACAREGSARLTRFKRKRERRALTPKSLLATWHYVIIYSVEMQGQNAKGYAGPIPFLSLGSRPFVEPVIFIFTRVTRFRRLNYCVIRCFCSREARVLSRNDLGNNR